MEECTRCHRNTEGDILVVIPYPMTCHSVISETPHGIARGVSLRIEVSVTVGTYLILKFLISPLKYLP
jgi:hypothetical protein